MAEERSRRYAAQTIADADYSDFIALLVKSLFHNLELAAGGISFHVNAKTEYMWFNQRGHISKLQGGSLKLVDKFTYHGSSVSSTENDVNTWLAKAWTANDSLSLTMNSDLSDIIKQFFSSSGRVDTTIWIHLMDATDTYGEKAWRHLHNNAASCIE